MPAASVLAVASGIMCNGTAKSLPSKEGTKRPLSPKTGPSCNTRRDKLLTSLGSITGLPCRLTLSKVSGARAVGPNTLKRSSRRHGRGLTRMLSKCFSRKTRRLGIGMFNISGLGSTVRRPRGPRCTGFAVHMSKCTIGFVSLAHRRRLSIVTEAYRSRVWCDRTVQERAMGSSYGLTYWRAFS